VSAKSLTSLDHAVAARAALQALSASLGDSLDVRSVDASLDELQILILRLRRDAGLCAGGLLLVPDDDPWECQEQAVTSVERDELSYGLCASCAKRVASA